MEYLLLKSDMTFKRFVPKFHEFSGYNPDKYALLEVEDDYYVKENFGLYTNDDKRALSHAVKMLKKLAVSPVHSHESYVKLLFDDLGRYVRFYVSNEKECHKFLRMVFELSVELDYTDCIPAFVREYYREKYLPEMERGYGSLEMDYHDLYIKLGDYELFKKGNSKLALQFYSLADLDWYFLRDKTSRVEIDLSEEMCKKLLSWHDSVLFMTEVYSGNLIESEFYPEEKREKSFWDACITFRDRKSETEDIAYTANVAELCMRELLTCAGEKEMRGSVFRELCVAMHGIRRDSIFPTICVLSRDTKENKALYTTEAMQSLASFRDGKQGIIGNYVRQHREKLVGEMVFMLCEAVNLIDSIKAQLLVRELKQDMAYYTSLRTLLYMLPDEAKTEEACGKLAVMHIAYMNDPNEGKILEKYFFADRGTAIPEEDRKSIEFPFVFMKCFTSLIDDLPMWEMYGDHAEGCCIVLDWENTMCSETVVPLYRVCYMKKNGSRYSVLKGDNKQIGDMAKFQKDLSRLARIAQEVGASRDAYQVFGEFVKDIAYLFKNSDYAHEQEMRILYHQNPREHSFCHTEGQFPKLYVKTEFNVCMKEIIMGPKCADLVERVPYIQELLNKLSQKTGIPMPRLTISAIDYM